MIRLVGRISKIMQYGQYDTVDECVKWKKSIQSDGREIYSSIVRHVVLGCGGSA